MAVRVLRPLLVLEPFLLRLCIAVHCAVVLRCERKQLTRRRRICRCLPRDRQLVDSPFAGRTHPPPVMMLPRRCSSSRYSSIVIVGSRWLFRKTSPRNRSRSESEPVLGSIVNGLKTLPPPEMSSRGFAWAAGPLSKRQVSSASALRVSRGSKEGGSDSEGAEARSSSSCLLVCKVDRARVCSRRSRRRARSRFSGGSDSGLTDVEDWPVDKEATKGREGGEGSKERIKTMGEDDGDG